VLLKCLAVSMRRVEGVESKYRASEEIESSGGNVMREVEKIKGESSRGGCWLAWRGVDLRGRGLQERMAFGRRLGG
jgi:hypothetical protein